MPNRYKKAESLTLILAALKERDILTFKHSDRTSALSVALGESCRLNQDELEILTMAAIVHDIGKIGIPDKVLLKPGRLDEQEWEAIKTHPFRGSDMLRTMEQAVLNQVADVVLHHHENFAGNGYPDGIGGDDIPLMARIIALADNYDAMADVRSYHEPKAHKAIMRVMNEERGNKFDPWLFDRFAELIEHSPHQSTNSE